MSKWLIFPDSDGDVWVLPEWISTDRFLNDHYVPTADRIETYNIETRELDEAEKHLLAIIDMMPRDASGGRSLRATDERVWLGWSAVYEENGETVDYYLIYGEMYRNMKEQYANAGVDEGSK